MLEKIIGYPSYLYQIITQSEKVKSTLIINEIGCVESLFLLANNNFFEFNSIWEERVVLFEEFGVARTTEIFSGNLILDQLQNKFTD